MWMARWRAILIMVSTSGAHGPRAYRVCAWRVRFRQGVAVKPHTGEVTGVSLHPTGAPLPCVGFPFLGMRIREVAI